MLVRSKPCSVNMRLAASRIAAPLARSFGRPGLAGLAGVAAGLPAWVADLASYSPNWFGIYKPGASAFSARRVFRRTAGAGGAGGRGGRLAGMGSGHGLILYQLVRYL